MSKCTLIAFYLIKIHKCFDPQLEFSSVYKLYFNVNIVMYVKSITINSHKFKIMLDQSFVCKNNLIKFVKNIGQKKLLN